MDLTKVIKIRSVENAVYTKDYNRMRFSIPADNLNTHLNESYVNLQVVLMDNSVNPPVPVDTSATNYGFGNEYSSVPYYSTCLLKVVRLYRQDSNVPLEEIRNFNILDINMKTYTRGNENRITDQFDNGFFIQDTFGASKSSFFQESYTEVHIPLKDIFGLCQNKDFYLSEVGGLLIEFELEDQYRLFIQDDTAFKSFPIGDLKPKPTPVSTQNATYRALLGNADPITLAVDEPPAQEVISDDPETWKPPLLNIEGGATTVGAYNVSGSFFAITLTVSLDDDNSSPDYALIGVSNSAQNDIIVASDKNIPIFLCNTTGATLETFCCNTWTVDTPFAPAVGTGDPTKMVIACKVYCDDAFTSDSCFLGFVHGFTSVPKWLLLPNVVEATPTADIPVSANLKGAMSTVLDKNTFLNYSQGNLTIDVSGSGVSPVLIAGKKYELYYQSVFQPPTDTVPLVLVLTGHDIEQPFIKRQPQKYPTDTSRQLVMTASTASLLSLNFPISITQPATQLPLFGQLYLRLLGNTTDALDSVQNVNITYQIPKAEVVLFQSAKQSSDSPPSVYRTFKYEATNIEYLVETWNKQFILEPNVFNCYILSNLISDNELLTTNTSLVSFIPNLNRYRWSVNNIDNTNRDVKINEKLHLDKLIDTFNNSDMSLRNLKATADDGSQNIGQLLPIKIYTSRDDGNVYMNNATSTLQLKLVASADNKLPISQLYLFKELFKQL